MILDVDFPSIFDDQHWYFPDDSFDTCTRDKVAFDAVDEYDVMSATKMEEWREDQFHIIEMLPQNF